MRFRHHQDQARSATRRLLLWFVLTVLLTVLAVNLALWIIWRLSVGGVFGLPTGFFLTNTLVTLGFVLGGCWLETLQLRQGGARVAEQVGGREVLAPRDSRERRLRNVVEEMAIASGLKPPRIFVLDKEEAINAFAAGWEQQDSVVAVTRGALERLNRDELQGVVAHEFGHILNGDTRLNMRLIGYVYGLQLVYLFGRSLVNATNARGERTPAVLPGLGLMVAGSIGWMAGRLLRAAVSRQREFLADASAVQYTRLADGLGGALRKIAGLQRSAQANMRHSQAEVVSHMLLHSSLHARLFDHSALDTHPPLSERLRRIYGKPMPELDAPVLADAQDTPRELPPLAYSEEASPQAGTAGLVAQTPAIVGGVAGEFAGAAAGDAAEAVTHQPAVLDASPPQAPAWLQGLLDEDWSGELQPSLLALMVSADSEAEARSWRAAFERLGAHPSTLTEATSTRAAPVAPGEPHPLLLRSWALHPALRQPAFERLLNRCEALPEAQRQALRRLALDIARADGRLTLPEVWRCLVLDALLRSHATPMVSEPKHFSLAERLPQLLTLTRVLARMRFGEGDDAREQRRAWRQGVLNALGMPPQAMQAAQPLLHLDLADTRELAQAARELRQLSWMQRPALLKAWCSTEQPWPIAFSDALRALCLLIDTPMPPALVAQYPSL